jgi:hypothetical protein
VGSRTTQVALVTLLLASAVAGCTPRHRASPSPSASSADQDPQAEWSLTVTNRHSLDVSVYVMYDGQRSHVGVVSAYGTATFLLAPTMLSAGRTPRLEANAIGSPRRLTTDAIPVRPGQHVEWILDNGLDHSNVSVW